MKVDRLLSIIIYLLNRDLVSARTLADRFGVTVRTIQRDMESLQEAGIPIIAIQGPSGGYGIMDTWKMDRQLLSIDNLFYILTALEGIHETIEDQRLGETLEKMRSILPSREASSLSERKEKLFVDFSMLGGTERNNELFRVIQEGIDKNRLIRFEYTSNRLERSLRTIEPMTLVFKWRSWYLFAFCRLREDFRLFRISRIKKAELLPRRFTRREVRLAEYLQRLNTPEKNKSVQLLLKFDKFIAPVAEENFSQYIVRRNRDGSLIVETAMPEDGWLYGYLLSFGSFLEVLEPDHIRAILRSEGDKIKKIYSITT